MAHAREPGRSTRLQRRSCLRGVRRRHRQRNAHRSGFRRRGPAPRGHRGHREVRGIGAPGEGLKPRVRVTGHRANLILGLLCAAQFMLILDIAIVNVALPSMQRTLGLSAENIQWVVGGYALTFGGFLMLGGRLADVFGRRRMFLAGLVLFVGASMLGGFSQSGGMLIAARVIQGFAGALVSPAALSLLTTTFKEGRERNRALGMWSAMAAGGASAGLILGGLLTQELSWRFTLFVNLPLGLAALLLAPVLPADAPGRGAKVSLDVPGAVSLTGGVLAFAYGVTEATGQGFASTRVLVALALSAALLVAFVVVEKNSGQPLLPGRMLRLRSVVAGNSVAALVSVVMIGAVFFNSLYLQEILGYSPIQAGLAWLPQTVLIMVVSNVGARVAMKLGPRTLIALGTAALGGGMILFLRTSPESDYVTIVLPAMLVTGVGVGLAFVSVTMAATAGVPDRDQGIASGLIGTAQQVGMAVGLAILVNVAGSVTRASLPQGGGAVVAGYHQAFVIGAAISFLAALVALIVIKRPSALPALDIANVSAPRVA
ncbi:MAG: MFS transporter [Chloroflexi bacterium]|nr:MAG: MFS transporter [Chloroflexota bacterium]